MQNVKNDLQSAKELLGDACQIIYMYSTPQHHNNTSLSCFHLMVQYQVNKVFMTWSLSVKYQYCLSAFQRMAFVIALMCIM